MDRPALSLVTLVVREYEEAIEFFTEAVGFSLVADRPEGGRRWVVVRPPGAQTGLLLARADGPVQEAVVGRQAGGRVFMFLETDDFTRDHARMRAAGVRFREEPRVEAYGTVAVFEDLYGNPWDLIQPS